MYFNIYIYRWHVNLFDYQTLLRKSRTSSYNIKANGEFNLSCGQCLTHLSVGMTRHEKMFLYKKSIKKNEGDKECKMLLQNV